MREIVIDRLKRGTEPGPLHLSAIMRRGNDALDHVGGNGEADADTAARLRIDGAVDANEMPVHRDQRTAGIARIDGGVGLDEELIIRRADMRARQRRDDTGCDGLADTEGIADGEHQIAHFEQVRIPEGEIGQLLLAGIDAQHGQIGALIGEHQFGLEFAPVGQRHRELLPVLHDMEVGDDEAIRIDDHTGSERLLHTLARHAEAAPVAEELPEKGVVEEGRARLLLHHPLRVDIDDGGRDALHHRRIGKLNLLAARGHLLYVAGMRRPRKENESGGQDNGGQHHRHGPRKRRFRQHFHHHDARPREKDGHWPRKPRINSPRRNFAGRRRR